MIRFYVQIYEKNQMKPKVQVHVPLPEAPKTISDIPDFVLERLKKHGMTEKQVKEILTKIHKPGSKLRFETPTHDIVVEHLT